MKKSFFCAFFILVSLCMHFSLNAAAPVPTDNEYWGYHLILDCSNCDKAAITSEKELRAFIKTLVDTIDMKAYGDLTITWFGSGKTTGYSLVQLIETSSITGHFVDETGEAYIDIFSCQFFDTELAKKVVRDFFKPKKIKTVYLTRQA